MRIPLLLLSLTATAALAQSEPAPAVQAPRLAIAPSQAEGGSLVRLTIDPLSVSDGMTPTIRGRMAGEPLHFTIDDRGVAEAIGAVPIDGSDSVLAVVEVLHPAGRVDTLRAAVIYPPRPVEPASRARASRLRVARRFTAPRDSATEARIARENAKARAVGRQAHETPRLWIQPFTRPRQARITSTFANRRVFNGRVASSHGGVDFAGRTGDPVRAANRGVVALADTFFLAGRVVYVDHGQGVVTGYFHLSEIRVAPGDTVEKGQIVGLVGSTGRVTGPHLHWSARYGALTVDPMDLVEITARRD